VVLVTDAGDRLLGKVGFPHKAVFPKQAYSSDQDRATVALGAGKNAPATCQNLCAEVLVDQNKSLEPQMNATYPRLSACISVKFGLIERTIRGIVPGHGGSRTGNGSNAIALNACRLPVAHRGDHGYERTHVPRRALREPDRRRFRVRFGVPVRPAPPPST
jgi:hypothetical protein